MEHHSLMDQLLIIDQGSTYIALLNDVSITYSITVSVTVANMLLTAGDTLSTPMKLAAYPTTLH